jgi:hypothetical protein
MNSNPYAVLSGSQETGSADVELVGEKEPIDLECEVCIPFRICIAMRQI